MKNWNKKKQYSNWVPVDFYIRRVGVLWWETPSVDAKVWCQRHPSPGRFFYQPYVGKFWFEFSEDALAFSLVWGNKVR